MDYRFLRLLSVCLPLLMAVVPVWGQDGSGDGSTKETGLSIDIREMPLPEVLTQLIKKDSNHENLYVLDRGFSSLENYDNVTKQQGKFVGRIKTNRKMEVVRSLKA